ncbi:MAG: hypothetical protein IKA22_09445 [Lentisphaeria bacterium]|nr:hypothetical protein [Lentisphaeria bacterium]
MAIIKMKGVKIKNLDQLRENFDFTNAKDYLLQGTLSAWMREQGETELADELNELKDQNYSDQTMADNFAGIFGLEQPTYVAEATAEIVVAENPVSIQVPTDEISIGRGSFPLGSCFGKTGVVYLDEEKMARYGLDGGDGKINDLRRFAKNRLVLYLIFKVANSVLHEDFVKDNDYQLTLDLETSFCDVGWGAEQFKQLKELLTSYFSFPNECWWYDTSLYVYFNAEGWTHICSCKGVLAFAGQTQVVFRNDSNYDGKFTHLCANGCWDQLVEEYGLCRI